MKKIDLTIILYLTIILLSSCERPDSNLPDNFLISNIDEFNDSTHKIYIYKVEIKDYNQNELTKTSIKCRVNWKSEKWRKLDITKKEDERISIIIKEFTRIIDSDDINELIQSIDSGSNIYIATCYVFMAKNTFYEHKSYERLYIFDEKNMKYYISKRQHGL